MEKRVFTISELRAADTGKITGHAAVFNSPTRIYRDMWERIAPTAFTRALQEKQDVRALFNHDPNFVLGRSKTGSLKLSEDSRGLAIEIYPPDTQWAKDLMTSIKRGDIDQMSFAFRTKKDSFEETIIEGEKVVLRTLMDVDLMDVSPVTFPAYEDTDLQARSNVPEEVRQKVAEFIQSRAKENLPPEGAGAPTGPNWEESQERRGLMRRRVELAEKI